MKKFIINKIKHPSILFLVVSIGFPLFMCTLCWTTALVKRIPPSPLPSPPEKVEMLLGIYTGGIEVTDPVILSVGGKEYIYLDSLVREEWVSLDEYPLYDDNSSLEKKNCGRNVTNIIEKKAGEIVVCMEAASVGEWTPGPIGYYALSSSGKIWRYKDYFSFKPVLLIFLFMGIFLGLFTVITSLKKEELKNTNNHEPA